MRRRSHIAIALLPLVVCFGCAGDATSITGPGAASKVSIEYQGKPLADCQVVLHSRTGNEFYPQWKGFSDSTGTAVLDEAQANSPSASASGTFRATLTSHGDGGWILDPRFGDPKTSTMDVTLGDETPARIQLPVGAIRPL